MRYRGRALCAAVLAVCLFAWPNGHPAYGQAADAPRGRVTVRTESTAERRAWTSRVDSMLRDGELRLRESREDPLVPGRTQERADQYYRGVRVFGADVSRQLRNGATESIFGTIYEAITVETDPAIDEDRARELLGARLGVTIDASTSVELVVLPLDAGGYALAWRIRVVTRGDTRQYFINARTGASLLDYSDRKTQTAVGRATGVLGDLKKISVRTSGGQYQTRDDLRPPDIETYDMKGDPARTDRVLIGLVNLSSNDLGTDADNDWTDGAIGDAHIYAGYTYDYYFKRFGRRGLNNADLRMQNLVHPVRRADIDIYGDLYPDFFVNAFYNGNGVMSRSPAAPASRSMPTHSAATSARTCRSRSAATMIAGGDGRFKGSSATGARC